MIMKFLIFNGKIVKYEDISLREFYMTNSLQLTQKIWFGYGGIPLFSQNIDLLIHQAEILHLPLPGQIKNIKELFRLSKRMLNKNKNYLSGFIIFKLISDGSSSIITASSVPYAEQGLPYNEQGLLVTISDHKKFSYNRLNRYHFFNQPLWDSILFSLKGTLYNNAVILNEQNNICECAYGNIYLVKGDEIFTPSLSTGCYEDTFRTMINKAATDTGKKLAEVPDIAGSDLFKMDEIFIAGENIGIQWLLGVENKRYIHYYSSVIRNQLNVMLEEKAS
jgi:branched-subunit amino acid aminotransferase/4-amino-4-deoxychorismate lyase